MVDTLLIQTADVDVPDIIHTIPRVVPNGRWMLLLLRAPSSGEA